MADELSQDVFAMIGATKVRHYEVAKKDIKRFSQAIGETYPVACDEACAEGTDDDAIVAPPLFCQVFTFEDVSSDLLPSDGSPVEIDVPLPARRTVGGASSYEIFKRVRSGDHITAKSTLKDVFSKQGKAAPLYFVVVETEFSNQDDVLVARETATYIKRV